MYKVHSTYLHIDIRSVVDKYANTVNQILVHGAMKGCQTSFVLCILIGSLLAQLLQYTVLFPENSACMY